MKTNRPTKDRHSRQTWYDLGYKDAVLDHDFTDTAYDTGWDKGWMEAKDDMGKVMEIVHFCLQNGSPEFGQLIIEHYINYKGHNDE